MLVDKKIFVHIPKNAGCTVRLSPLFKDRIIEGTRDNHKSQEYSEAVLAHMNSIGDHHGFEHARWRDFKSSLTSSYDAFAIIRNPWDRTVSRFLFAKKIIEVEKKEPKGKHPIESFEAFIDDRHKWGNMEYMWHRAIRGWYPQTDYVTDNEGNIKCDCLKFEDLDNQLKLYFKLDTMTRPRNVTGLLKGSYTELYTPETKQIIGDWYKKDIDTFGFDFETGATKNIWTL
jgi:hypothetical protein